MKLLILALLLTSCTPKPETPVIVSPTPSERIKLSWENTTAPHPERAAWSDEIIKILDAQWVVYSAAKDSKDFCPKYASLNKLLQQKAIGEFLVGIAYYESGYDPKNYSVDVGTQADKESWSAGLFQMSGNDSAAKKFGYDFIKLQDPINNIQVALEQFNRQITKSGVWMLDNSAPNRYWATVLKSNKHSHIDSIVVKVKSNAKECN